MSLLTEASLILTPNAYKAGKLYSIIPSDGSGDMTVLRATTATRVNSLGLIESVANNVPRIDYTNGSCPSILVEPQRTNTLLYSNEFTNSNWQKINSSTITFTSSVLNPEGSGSYYFTASNLAFGNILRQTNTFSIGQTHTVSFFVKKGNYTYVGFRVGNSINGLRYPTYDFDTDTLNKQGVTCTFNRTILNNGWVKVSLTFTQTNAASACDLAIVTSNGESSIALSGGEFVYVYGAQLEQDSYPTSYIPTVASTVTRNVDVIYKTNASALIGQTEGSIYLEFYYSAITQVVELFNIFDTAPSYLFRARINSAGANTFSVVYANGSSANFSSSITLIPNSVNKILVKYNYASKITRTFCNGIFIGQVVGTINFPSSQNKIGVGNWFGVSIKSEHKLIALWKNQITDAQAISLTTL